MVKYHIGIFDQKENRDICLNIIKEYNNLQELDEFTSLFNNENEFKIYLFNKGLISLEEKDLQIKIMYKYNGKINILSVLYKNKENNLINSIKNSKNYRYLRELRLIMSAFITEKTENDILKQKYNQICFFEEEFCNQTKWTLSENDEPDFPPNSEEEENYLRYLEELETPISSDIEERSHVR